MDKRVGVLGGGQLGAMLVEAANQLRIPVNVLDVGHSSAKQISSIGTHIEGSFKDPEAIKKLADISDVVTVEIEHVDTTILEKIAGTVDVQPSWKTIRKIQDKYAQKQHLHERGVATAESVALKTASMEEMEKASRDVGLPLMLKSRREAYDGRGNYPVRTKDDFNLALEALGGNKDLYAEKWANFRVELAVMVVKTKDDVLSFPTTETVHENSICKLTYTPARGVSEAISQKAQELARKAVACFDGKGVFGVEMFLLEDDTLLVNEIAPRPHNSGHYTIEACRVSQYEAHLSAILDLPLQQEDLQLREPAVMLNILGGEAKDSHLKIAQAALKDRWLKVHLYGKGQARKGRKMGHVTVCAPTMSEAERRMQPLIDLVDEGKPAQPKGVKGQPANEESAKNKPLVAVVMGSDSDLPKLADGLKILRDFNIPYTARVTSAHRTPYLMAEYASSAASEGIKCVIAAAGGAAHLPGMFAAYTPLPVIGVPIKPSLGDGRDSVLSILNMPRGVPVATVSLNNSTNAALLAVRILGAGDEAIRERYVRYMREAEAAVKEKDRRLQEVGAEKYLESMAK
ncbi:hypothetical protein B0A55_04094 [Friedmanniomyces simplex]|uniref:Phosphoribosylaminoimidazole carboxylase n=1 Tax=Friedmanniomyces simplex TaxID=329884 RepID=A0A4U0XIZ6_9PEZI|nr:hypothetical protein B0A55_04094 [Friedmanniomyces simplex]